MSSYVLMLLSFSDRDTDTLICVVASSYMFHSRCRGLGLSQTTVTKSVEQQSYFFRAHTSQCSLVGVRFPFPFPSVSKDTPFGHGV